MRITFENESLNTEVSLSDGTLTADGEISIHVSSEDGEATHYFQSFKEFDDFYHAVDTYRDRMKDHFGLR
ncbi:hypothetical protein [Albibacterium profundi]|uniref:Uncharacterized protein n=1 Tax=Albibacterium profundi TaxID=3134906 RepID=A0ABV5CHM5_9SPHI